MKVLKFGGSSVGSAESIEKVVAIVKAATEKDFCVVVLSAMQGATDALIETGKLAERGDENFRVEIREIETKHLAAVRELLPIQEQSGLLSFVKKRINELENICEGVFLLRELSLRTLDLIVSFGEILSTKIAAAKFDSIRLENVWKDSRELIKTDSNFSFAQVDFDRTNSTIKDFFQNSNAKLGIEALHCSAFSAQYCISVRLRGPLHWIAALGFL